MVRIALFCTLAVATLPSCLLLVDQPFDSDTGSADMPDSGWVRFQITGTETCALNDDGSLWCLPSFESEGTWRVRDTGLRSVGAGIHDGCIVDGDGALICEEVLGDVFELPGPFTLVDGDAETGCAVTESGEPVCWPQGDGPSGLDYIRVGGGAACGLEGDALTCWIIDSGSSADDIANAPIDDVLAVSLGRDAACALDLDDELHCWGSDYSDVLEGAPIGERFADIAVGGDHACVLTFDGEVECWGATTKQQLAVPTDVTFAAIAASGDRNCGVSESGALMCWDGD